MFYYGETDLEELLQIANELSASRSSITLARETVLEQLNAQRDRASSFQSTTYTANMSRNPAPATFSPSQRFLDAVRDEEIINSLPETDIVDELVLLYFSNLHHLCPIINESRFCQQYFDRGLEEFLQTYPFILFIAILSVALAHIDADQLPRMGFETLHEAQSAFVGVVKRLYRRARFETSHQDDELVLAKTCLLLSYWHGQIDTETNSCWADRAMHHVKASLKGNTPNSPADPYRRKTVYWCCIIRNTLINFATRRTYRVYAEEEPLFGVEEIRSELESEIAAPIFSSADAKRFHIETTIATCQLSQILSAIMRSQRQSQVESEWSARERMSASSAAPADGCVEYVRGFLEAGGFDGQIMAVLKSYEQRIRHLSGQNRGGAMHPHQASINTVPAEYFRTLCYSSIAVVYQPYLGRTMKSLAETCQRVALEKVNEASANVAAIAERLLRESNVEAIPGGLVAWLALPTVAFLIRRSSPSSPPHQSSPNNNTSSTSNSPPAPTSPPQDPTIDLDPENGPQEARKMLKLAYLIAHRHEAGEHIWKLLGEVHRLALLRDSQEQQQGGLNGDGDCAMSGNGSCGVEGSLATSPVGGNVGVAVGSSPDEEGVARGGQFEGDLDLLVRATRFLDLNLAYEGPRPALVR